MGSGLDIDIEAVQKEIQYWREWCDRQGCKNLEPILELAEQRLNTLRSVEQIRIAFVALAAAADNFQQKIQQRHRERMLMPMLPGAQSK